MRKTTISQDWVFRPCFLQSTLSNTTPWFLPFNLCSTLMSSTQASSFHSSLCSITPPFHSALSHSTIPCPQFVSHVLDSSASSSACSNPNSLFYLFRESCDHPGWVLSEPWHIIRVYVWLWWWWDFPCGYEKDRDSLAASRIWWICQLWSSGCIGQYSCGQSQPGHHDKALQPYPEYQW